METIIECSNLFHSYGKKSVLKELNFKIEKGKIFGLLGKNGVGKTTTINILMGFLAPTRGKCSIFNEPSHQISPLTRGRIGLVHEGFMQYDFMTIEQVEKFYSRFYKNWKRDLYYDLIDKMNLKYSHKISNMSCGQRSQITLGLIFAQDSELLILDDYSLGLDVGYRRLFLDYLNTHVKNSGKTVLLTSHIVQDLEKIVDDIIIIDQGNAIVNSSLTDFMKDFKAFKYRQVDSEPIPLKGEPISNYDQVGDEITVYSFTDMQTVQKTLKNQGIHNAELTKVNLSLEDAFIGITGKY